MTAATVEPLSPALTVPQLQRALRAVRFDASAGVKAAITGREGVAIVVGAHPGVGTSTVALALAESAAEMSATTVLLAEHAAAPALSAATEANLGEDDAGWRIGRRGRILIASRASTPGAAGWLAADAQTLVIDIGTQLEAVPPDCAVVLVCRPTVPSLRLAEQALVALPKTVAIAAMGPARWPRIVRTTAGPELSEKQRGGRVVHVPADRRIALTGVTPAPLPRPLLAAGRALLKLVTADRGRQP